jgi:hypothetical protein
VIVVVAVDLSGEESVFLEVTKTILVGDVGNNCTATELALLLLLFVLLLLLFVVFSFFSTHARFAFFVLGDSEGGELCGAS